MWTTTAGILFDNFLVAHSPLSAFEYAKNTTAAKALAEKKALKEEEKARELAERADMIANGDFSDKLQGYSEMVAEYLRDHPMIIVDAAIVVLLTMVYFLVFGWKQNQKQKKSTTKSTTAASAPATNVAAENKKEDSESEIETSAAIESKE